ncbi:mitochondrial cyclase homology domain-containing protein [Andalucia godoyi]|uniref:Mitochondrial cyclase homology domain-containing protein n=1 Tax=Andalucia godoyi TaxID=505711 RepID=A0A8K0AIF0_ANDGO|nr:mitochondrial cyclase homology domain-containing protein [Andalucia godoyi]|eukprot:ANDGO_04917.mRNA.1 mitochondrial cyclase homology domain-containing protein
MSRSMSTISVNMRSTLSNLFSRKHRWYSEEVQQAQIEFLYGKNIRNLRFCVAVLSCLFACFAGLDHRLGLNWPSLVLRSIMCSPLLLLLNVLLNAPLVWNRDRPLVVERLVAATLGLMLFAEAMLSVLSIKGSKVYAFPFCFLLGSSTLLLKLRSTLLHVLPHILSLFGILFGWMYIFLFQTCDEYATFTFVSTLGTIAVICSCFVIVGLQVPLSCIFSSMAACDVSYSRTSQLKEICRTTLGNLFPRETASTIFKMWLERDHASFVDECDPNSAFEDTSSIWAEEPIAAINDAAVDGGFAAKSVQDETSPQPTKGPRMMPQSIADAVSVSEGWGIILAVCLDIGIDVDIATHDASGFEAPLATALSQFIVALDSLGSRINLERWKPSASSQNTYLFACLDDPSCSLGESSDSHILSSHDTKPGCFSTDDGCKGHHHNAFSDERPPQCAALALKVSEVVRQINARFSQQMTTRVGLACGPITSGIVNGRKTLSYEIFGSSVKEAMILSRGVEKNAVGVNSAVYESCKHLFEFSDTRDSRYRCLLAAKDVSTPAVTLSFPTPFFVPGSDIPEHGALYRQEQALNVPNDVGSSVVIFRSSPRPFPPVSDGISMSEIVRDVFESPIPRHSPLNLFRSASSGGVLESSHLKHSRSAEKQPVAESSARKGDGLDQSARRPFPALRKLKFDRADPSPFRQASPQFSYDLVNIERTAVIGVGLSDEGETESMASSNRSRSVGNASSHAACSRTSSSELSEADISWSSLGNGLQSGSATQGHLLIHQSKKSPRSRAEERDISDGFCSHRSSASNATSVLSSLPHGKSSTRLASDAVSRLLDEESGLHRVPSDVGSNVPTRSHNLKFIDFLKHPINGNVPSASMNNSAVVSFSVHDFPVYVFLPVLALLVFLAFLMCWTPILHIEEKGLVIAMTLQCVAAGSVLSVFLPIPVVRQNFWIGVWLACSLIPVSTSLLFRSSFFNFLFSSSYMVILPICSLPIRRGPYLLEGFFVLQLAFVIVNGALFFGFPALLFIIGSVFLMCVFGLRFCDFMTLNFPRIMNLTRLENLSRMERRSWDFRARTILDECISKFFLQLRSDVAPEASVMGSEVMQCKSAVRGQTNLPKAVIPLDDFRISSVGFRTVDSIVAWISIDGVDDFIGRFGPSWTCKALASFDDFLASKCDACGFIIAKRFYGRYCVVGLATEHVPAFAIPNLPTEQSAHGISLALLACRLMDDCLNFCHLQEVPMHISCTVLQSSLSVFVRGTKKFGMDVFGRSVTQSENLLSKVPPNAIAVTAQIRNSVQEEFDSAPIHFTDILLERDLSSNKATGGRTLEDWWLIEPRKQRC